MTNWWRKDLSQEQLSLMRSLIEDSAAKHGFVVAWDSGTVTFQDDESGSLQNLGARLGNAEEGSWVLRSPSPG